MNVREHIATHGSLTLRAEGLPPIVIHRYPNGPTLFGKSGSCESPLDSAQPLASAVRFMGRRGTVYTCRLGGRTVEVLTPKDEAMRFRVYRGGLEPREFAAAAKCLDYCGSIDDGTHQITVRDIGTGLVLQAWEIR